jgi:hypothetical protein
MVYDKIMYGNRVAGQFGRQKLASRSIILLHQILSLGLICRLRSQPSPALS